MESHVWLIAAIWMALALVASLISIGLGVSSKPANTLGIVFRCASIGD